MDNRAYFINKYISENFYADSSKKLDPERIKFVRFEASESRAWSQITFESFSCRVYFAIDGTNKEESMYMDESDVVTFLNEFHQSL